MDPFKLIKELLATRAEKAQERDAKRSAATDITTKVEEEKRDALSAEEQADFEARVAEAKAIDTELREIDERLEELYDQAVRDGKAAEIRSQFGGTSIEVTKEPLTYERNNGNSYLRDLAQANAPGNRSEKAAERLSRHSAEVRATMNRTDGTGGEFVPPLWLMDEYVALARAGRVTADLCRMLPLPGGTDSINLPKISTGTATAEQSDGGAVQNTDATTTSVSAAVTTIAGQQVFAMQLLDQSPINFDEVVFQDLLADLAKQVDVYVLNKAAIGILNVTGIVSVTYTDATPTVPELYPKGADAVQQIGANRFLPAQAHVMHPRRWGWMLASLDSSNRPLVVPNGQGPTNAFAGMTDVRAEGSVGTWHGLPVYVDANIPTTLGAGTEDAIVTARFDDLYLYEGEVRTRALFETDADTLKVRLQVWEYLAFLGSRYPKSIAKVTGTGLIAPTF